ncbi:ATP-binding protein [Clostridium sp.]|uniref:ATP-binding protein n=1 Tax=Clostridium sp. TaxID=1506 RepID=UPI002FC798DC
MRNLSIKRKLQFMIIVIFIPIIIYQFFKINNEFEKSIDRELKANEDFAQAVNSAFTNYIDGIWNNELSMGLAISNDIGSSEEIGNYMKSISENQPTIKQYSWIDISTLKVSASSNPQALGVSIDGREYINKIINGENRVISDMLISRVDGKKVFVVARGIRKDNVLIGIITATINVEDLDKVLPVNRGIDYSSFGLIDSQGVFVYRYGISDIADKMISVKEDPILKTVLEGEIVKSRKFKSSLNGKNMIGVSVPINKLGWVASGSSSYDEVLLRTFIGVKSDIIMLVFMVVVGIIASVFIGRQILHPISVLKSSAMEMSKGNLNVRTKITGKDEIALAAQAFDQMAAHIEEYDNLKTQFFSNLSHELKTPLNIMLSSIQLIENMHTDKVYCKTFKNTSKYMTMMKQNSYRLLRLINNLIDITRIDAGFLKIRFGNHNIVSLIEDITLSVANYAETRGINVIFDTEMEEKVIGCDPDSIERIILNILSNSIKFTPPGGSIFVCIFDRKDKITISVKDSGIGIPSDKIDIIFDRFRQVDTSLHRKCEGSGIGLSLVKALVVDGLKGNIYAQSESGKGTEITIDLPVFLVPEDDSIEVNNLNDTMDRVQRINIEFSDIYN